MATPAPYLADEILEEIFVRLPHPQALGCAAIASPSFRRIITQRRFLRRFRKLHPPPLLGFVTDRGGFNPAQEPHPSAPMARALAGAADFGYSFVPLPKPRQAFAPWSACDVRDGRVLLESRRCFSAGILHRALAVCDPLSRRYLVLPPLPLDPYQGSVKRKNTYNFQQRLAAMGEDEEETSFRVILWVTCSSKIVTFVFSSATGQWCMPASPSRSSLGIDDPSWRKVLPRLKYSSSCFYWMARWKDKVLVMDTRTMHFSAANIRTGDHMQLMNLPPESKCTSSTVVPTEGALEMFTVVTDGSPNGSFDLYHTTQQNNDGSCQLKIVILFPLGCCYYTVGATEGFVFLTGIRDQARLDYNAPLEDLFSLEIKTSQLKKVYRGPALIFRFVHSYFGLPPLLSKPSL